MSTDIIMPTITPRIHLSARSAHRLTAASQMVKCQGCYSPISLGKVSLPKHHPCLFCNVCLATVTEKGTHKYQRDVLSKSASQQSDISAWDRNGGAEMAGQHRYSCNEVLLNASLKSTTGLSQLPHLQKTAGSATEASSSQRFRKEEFVDKLQDLEIRATRCGFCFPWTKRRKLVTYCTQCGKYICRQHTKYHKENRYTKLHGTVNLLLVPNDALL